MTRWRPWAEPTPTRAEDAIALLHARIPFNAARLAALADAIEPRGSTSARERYAPTPTAAAGARS